MSNQNSTLSTGVKATVLTLGFLMLGVSTYHAGSFMLKMSDDPLQRIAMIATVVALLASSHALARLAGVGIGRGKWLIALACIACILCLESFSVATSAASLSNRAMVATRSENLASPEYKMAMQNVKNYQSQIAQLQASANKLPTNYATKRAQIMDKVVMVQTRLERAQRDANNVNVSTTAAALSGLERGYGITSSDIAMVASVMLSVTPMIMGIAVGALGSSSRRRVSQEQETVKKPQPLRSVA